MHVKPYAETTPAPFTATATPSDVETARSDAVAAHLRDVERRNGMTTDGRG